MTDENAGRDPAVKREEQYNRTVLHEDMGPYRIEERLGTGGMGEVYKAWDSRLDRWVALKFVRADATETMKARERFRREARAAAGLSHPSVVQIHDILEREDGDCIVMELVEGESLDRLVKEGPLELERAVRLGREIAEGLASAHAKGIVHRDLKAENIMITAEDHPKILDFGLAKSLRSETPEATLSIDGRVVGTGYAMSPEQAQGFEVDHRSDLFSFGTLLYQMVTGISPFRRPALAETLTRVCVYQQKPAAELRPETPQELSALIERLLAKKPDDRPQETAEVVVALRRLEPSLSATLDPVSQPTLVDLPRVSGTATASAPAAASPAGSVPGGATAVGPAGREGSDDDSGGPWSRALEPLQSRRLWLSALLLLALAATALWALRPSPPPPLLVAVPKPEVVDPGQVSDLDLMLSGLRVVALQSLLGLENIHPLAPDHVDDIGESFDELFRATAADEVLASRLQCRESRCLITVFRVGNNGQLVGTDSFELPTDDLLLMSTTMGDRVSRLYASARQGVGQRRLEVQEKDYEEFLRTREVFLRRPEEATVQDLLARVEKIQSTSPRFVPAYLLEAEMARAQFSTSRSSEDLERAFAAIEQARSLAPEDPLPLYELATLALESRRLATADEAIHKLEQSQPGDPRLSALRAFLLENRGRPEEALDLLESAVRQRPSVQNLFDLANMEVRHGRTESARRHLRELLARFPNKFSARKVLAQIELQSGSAEAAARLYEDLVELSPEPDLLANLGVVYLLLEEYEKASTAFRRVREQQPNNPYATLNLADALLLQGKEEEAMALYRQVIDLIDKDPAGSGGWQFFTIKAQAYAHLGEDRKAASLAQKALQMAPGNSQVSYEAAVVYAVIGDRASAMVNVERALDQGYEPRWFRFAWFDDLRALPDFGLLLDSHRTKSGIGD